VTRGRYADEGREEVASGAGKTLSL